jgi:hypothetical protein
LLVNLPTVSCAGHKGHAGADLHYLQGQFLTGHPGHGHACYVSIKGTGINLKGLKSVDAVCHCRYPVDPSLSGNTTGHIPDGFHIPGLLKTLFHFLKFCNIRDTARKI